MARTLKTTLINANDNILLHTTLSHYFALRDFYKMYIELVAWIKNETDLITQYMHTPDKTVQDKKNVST